MPHPFVNHIRNRAITTVVTGSHCEQIVRNFNLQEAYNVQSL